MNREDPYRDQAERLRKKIAKNKIESDQPLPVKEALPPRSRLHQEKRKKNKWKIKYPVIRLLALFFILLPITIFSMYQYLQNRDDAEKVDSTKSGFETVGYENRDENKEIMIEESEETPVHKDRPSTDDAANNVTDEVIPPPRDPVTGDEGDKGASDAAEQEEQPKAPVEKQQPEQEKVVYHTVKQSETLYRIAMNYYQSPAGVEKIKKANNLKNNEIRVGQVLTIPKN
ncbi:LysM repeat protein [Cytobacillus eiseniae]|uniref:LysM repeat protein n=1 Tax=Cytobacillus eiseniae TaxID=762947 RepID=A0ABS4RCU1_9BACI|nr:LysM peptidoglycan-binding domain-containing protein [Cytobacillus eiseniae]MBP2240711.1 LysM repeat protein [Cytobacillus eiseniae]